MLTARYVLPFLIIQEVSNDMIRKQLHRNDEIMTGFSRDSPRAFRDLRRQSQFNLFGDARERAKVRFYQPYHHLGDQIFLRTTHAPAVKTEDVHMSAKPSGGGFSFDDYKNAKMETYRGCNLVCPKLFLNTGTVCGWYKRKRDDYFWQYASVGGYWRGHHETLEYMQFDSLCDLLKSNCRDLLVTGVTQPESLAIRLAHLGACISSAEYGALYNYSAPYIWKNYRNIKGGVVLELEEKTQQLMANTNIDSFATRKTTYRHAGPDDMSFIG